MADENKEETRDLSNPEVVDYYVTAGQVSDQVLKEVKERCVAGASIAELCRFGDKRLAELCAKRYAKNKELSRGVSHPTCISVNNLVGSFSPIDGTDDAQWGSTALKAGDLVKIDLGAQLNDYCTAAATTFVLSGADADAENKDAAATVTGRKADVLVAAHTAAEAAVRLIKAGKSNEDVTTAIAAIAQDFKCNPVQGVFSHQTEQAELESEKVIANSPPSSANNPNEKVKKMEFELNEVYIVDVVISTGDGKPSLSTIKPTVFKRIAGAHQSLTVKAARGMLHAIDSGFENYPFNIASVPTDKNKRFGIGRLIKAGLVESYEVLREKDNEFVAHVRFTTCIMPNGNLLRVSGGNALPANVKSEFSVSDEDLKALLKTNLKKKKKKKKSKKKKPAADANKA